MRVSRQDWRARGGRGARTYSDLLELAELLKEGAQVVGRRSVGEVPREADLRLPSLVRVSESERRVVRAGRGEHARRSRGHLAQRHANAACLPRRACNRGADCRRRQPGDAERSAGEHGGRQVADSRCGAKIFEVSLDELRSRVTRLCPRIVLLLLRGLTRAVWVKNILHGWCKSDYRTKIDLLETLNGGWSMLVVASHLSHAFRDVSACCISTCDQARSNPGGDTVFDRIFAKSLE